MFVLNDNLIRKKYIESNIANSVLNIFYMTLWVSYILYVIEERVIRLHFGYLLTGILNVATMQIDTNLLKYIFFNWVG